VRIRVFFDDAENAFYRIATRVEYEIVHPDGTPERLAFEMVNQPVYQRLSKLRGETRKIIRELVATDFPEAADELKQQVLATLVDFLSIVRPTPKFE
jgi:hypothetical protein